MAQVRRSEPFVPHTPALDDELGPLPESNSPAHDLQRMLIQRLEMEGDWMNAVSDRQLDLADHVDSLASRISRLAGPVLLVAAAIGLLALLI